MPVLRTIWIHEQTTWLKFGVSSLLKKVVLKVIVEVFKCHLNSVVS